MSMTTQVFLNTSHDGLLFGFRNVHSAPSVALVLKFELADTIARQLSAGAPVAALEHVYAQLNVDASWLEPWAQQYRDDDNRSLSVGDVVVVGECAFAVDGFGWQRITTDELLDAILLGHRVTADA